MTVHPTTSYTTFPSIHEASTKTKPNLYLETPPEEDFELFRGRTMAGTGPQSPYIKEETEDIQYDPNRFMSHNGFEMQQHFGGQQFGNTNGVNPSELTMSRSFMKDDFGSQNMSSGLINGNAQWTEEELADLDALNDLNGQNGGFSIMSGDGMAQQGAQGAHGYYEHGSMQHHQGNNVNQIYSNTPDGGPIMSPFVHNFNYEQFRTMHPQSLNTGVAGGFAQKRAMMERHHSDSRSPMTPKTPGLNGLHLGTPDSGNFSQPILTGQSVHRQQKSVSGQWEGTPGSGSWIDSPLPSPHGPGLHHPQISEVLVSKHGSLPTKVENGQSASVPGAFQSQEAKRRRRRESHNLVERRRRDNINERIQDLSRLVPQHRLEDEKIRKHIHNNGPLSPSIAANGISPPQATSLLAGGTGRRAAGSITQGLPLEEKDKGPNKGDILNGAVGWTRDLMWMLYRQLEQEEKLKEQLSEQGMPWPFELTEEEKRMRTEVIDAVEKNGAGTFTYSRAPGTGLRVPKHTNYAGDPMQGSISPQSLSPATQSGGSGTNPGQPQYWMNNGMLKEEDEYSMEMG